MNAPLTPNLLLAAGMQRESVMLAVPPDEAICVLQAPGVWLRRRMLNTVCNGWSNLLRARMSGALSRHRHPMAVCG